jgi:hypothetical protein
MGQGCHAPVVTSLFLSCDFLFAIARATGSNGVQGTNMRNADRLCPRRALPVASRGAPFSVVILEDCVATFDEEPHMASPRGLSFYLTVMDSAAFLRALAG